MARSENSPKDLAYYAKQRAKYEKHLHGNEFIKIPEVLDTVNSRIISLLNSDVKSREVIGFNRNTMEILKSLYFAPNVLARKVQYDVRPPPRSTRTAVVVAAPKKLLTGRR